MLLYWRKPVEVGGAWTLAFLLFGWL